jgi:hypothetical protein
MLDLSLNMKQMMQQPEVLKLDLDWNMEQRLPLAGDSQHVLNCG